VCILNFSRFSVFLAIFQVIQCLWLIFHIFQISPHNPGPRVCISHFQSFSVSLTIFPVINCAFVIFQLFHCIFFWPYSRSYRVSFSLSSYFSILTIIHYSHDYPGRTVYISHIPFFSLFLPIFQSYRVCFSFSILFSVFLLYSRSYSVHFTFSSVFSVSSHIPGHTVYISHFFFFFQCF
jgi:hypothetical protein